MKAQRILSLLLTAALFLTLFGQGERPVLARAPDRAPAVARAMASLPIDQVPPEFVRRAAQFLESMRGSEMAPTWGTAQLATSVVEMYRPDLGDKVAYYEFSVLVKQEPSGFIIVSTGPHDFPIPHWDFQGQSPSQMLDVLAIRNQITLVKYYRLDSLSYAGEDESTEQSVTNFDQPPKITGIDPDAANQPILVSQTSFTPPAGESDDNPSGKDWTPLQNGPAKADYTLTAWESWSELKAGYAASYGPMLQKLGREAERDWQIDALAAEFGEVLSKGDVRNIAVVCSGPELTASGDGLKFADVTLIRRDLDGLLPYIQVTVLADEFRVDHPLLLSIQCPNPIGLQTVNYVITAPVTRTFIPMISNNSGLANAAGESPAASRPAIPNTASSLTTNTLTTNTFSTTTQPARTTGIHSTMLNLGNWGPWNYLWDFNGTVDARLYNQIPPNTSPSNWSCNSGCGGTAWGMLFGWADYQAASPYWSYWSGRRGIYRPGGGYSGDTIAPQYADAGVNSMIWQISNAIGTFCWGTSGATTPWSMANAYQYLQGRSGARVDTHYNVLGISEDRLRDYAIRSIRDRRTPAIIGTGWLSHYPLAMGYAWTSRTVRACGICWWDTTEYARSFWVNQGWGGAGNGWVSASTWFAGELYP